MLKVISVALAEVGYIEGAGNITKYAAELDKLGDFYNGTKNGYAWCDVFVDWCFIKAYGRETAQKLLCQPDKSLGAGCTYSLRYYQQAGRWSNAPQIGAQIFFGSAAESYHTGLVYDMDNAYVYTVEGNTADGVFKRRYAIGAGNIYGYGLPDYSLLEDGGVSVYQGSYGEDDEIAYATPDKPTATVSTCAVTLPELKYGDVGAAVKAMQTLLTVQGFACGGCGADGEFGYATGQALANFQTERNLTVDKICGARSWSALIGG